MSVQVFTSSMWTVSAYTMHVVFRKMTPYIFRMSSLSVIFIISVSLPRDARSTSAYCYRKSSVRLSVCEVDVPWTPQNSGGIGVGSLFSAETCNISEMGQDRTKVTIDDQQEAYTL